MQQVDTFQNKIIAPKTNIRGRSVNGEYQNINLNILYNPNKYSK